jgi:hypothetical protein
MVSELEGFLVRHIEAGTMPGAVALRGGAVGILLTQVEMGERVGGMVNEFQALPPSS